ncbi:MAG: methyltransferase domain-containing protein [Trebonia sp.]
MQASAIAEQDTSPVTAYSRFRAAVAQAQFEHWLAELAPRGCVIDVSGPGAGTRAAAMAAQAGHSVLRVIPLAEPGGAPARAMPRRLRLVAADGGGLDFLASHSADAVIAEDRTLSRSLAAETIVGEIARVLKPGGRVLASVDSLTLGMSVLAQQHHWPHLVDLPHADVVLVPWPDGSITRCYGAEHLRELFAGSGFEVGWIRPRTVFAATTVSYLLDRDPGSFKQLVNAELRARGDDSVGDQLIVSAVLAR